MSTRVASLMVVLGADISEYRRRMRQASGDMKKTAREMESHGRKMSVWQKAFFLAAATTIVAGMRKAVLAYKEAEEQSKKLEQVIRSTGGAAGYNAEQLKIMAEQLQAVSTFEDDALVGAQALLLTFTKIGKDIFPQALETVMDMSVALGQDLKSSAVQVGKALQDPILGVTALRRVGVNFNKEQTEVIRKLVETGNAAEAQRKILAELKTEFGGQARAAAKGTGAMDQFTNAVDNLMETIGEKLSPSLIWLAQVGIPMVNDAIKEIDENKAVKVMGSVLDKVFGIKEWLDDLGAWSKHRKEVQETALAYEAMYQEMLQVYNLSGVFPADDISRALANAIIARRQAMEEEKRYRALMAKIPTTGLEGGLLSKKAIHEMETGLIALDYKLQTVITDFEDMVALPINMPIEQKLAKIKAAFSDLAIVSKENLQEWADEAAMATDVMMNGIYTFYSAVKSGEDVFRSLGEAITRMAEQAIFDFMRMKAYAWWLDFVSGGNAKVGAGGQVFPIGGTPAPTPVGVAPMGGGGVSITLNNTSGVPLQASGAAVTAGAGGQMNIEVIVQGAWSKLANSGRLDKTMKANYGLYRVAS